MTTFTTDQWVILGLVFLLGLLIGMWLTSGGRRKWKTRYNEEVTERKALEARLKEREAHLAAQEKDWREAESRHQAALRDRPIVPEQHQPIVEERIVERPVIVSDHREPIIEERVHDRRSAVPLTQYQDMDRDGIPDQHDRRPLDDRR